MADLLERLEQSEDKPIAAPAKASKRDRGTSAAFSVNSSLAGKPHHMSAEG